MKWFRLYSEVLHDHKVQSLDGDTFKAWVNLLCLASQNDGHLPSVDSICFNLRMDKHGVETLLERLLNATLIDKVSGGSSGYRYAPHNWNKRQYKSDTSTERVKRFRERSETVTVTPPDTDTDTEQIQKQKDISRTKQVRSGHKESFEKFWSSYPRKVGKGAAEKSWIKALQSTEADTIIASLVAYKFSEDVNFIPHPATWLNQRRWEDAMEMKGETEIKGFFIESKAASNYAPWKSYFERAALKFRLTALENAMDSKNRFPVPSEFPPP